jgi:tetratricopeptide (TPR) repeat protein
VKSTRNGGSKSRTRNRGVLVRAAVIALAAALVCLNSLSAPFIFDDEVAVVANPAIRSINGAWSQPRDTPLAGRPVAALTFAINFAASDLDPAAYRATNIAIHIACALMFFALLRRTLLLPRLKHRFGSPAADLAFGAALLWVVHPLTTDAVTYITQRTESLMALCYLSVLYASLRSAERGSTGWAIAAVSACVVGMGAKESMATAPLMVILYDGIFLYDSFRSAAAARWRLYAGLMLTWLVLAIELAVGPRAGSAGFSTGVSAWTYLLNQSVMVCRYLRLAAWPTDLAITYGAPVPYALSDVALESAVVIALLSLTAAALRRWPGAAFLGAWFFVTLAPSSSFVPIATEVGAERRMYLPLMAMTTALVVGLYSFRTLRSGTSRGLAAICLVIAATGFGLATIARNAEHQSWLTLAETTLERWPTDAAHAAVGGELSRLGRDEEALPHLRSGARSDARAQYNLGVTLYNLKRYDESIQALEHLVAEHPLREEVPWARRVMAQAYARQLTWSEAVAQLRMTLEMTPDDAEARRLLIDAYISRGIELAEAQNFTDAISDFRSALGYDDRNANARYNLATALFDAGRLNEALVEAERALALNPASADAYHLKGKLLALQGRLDESIVNLEAALKLRPDDAVIREDLARVHRAR